MENNNNNHAVCIPFPAQGHIRPMLKLAQLLHFKFGFHITFINTHYNHQTLFQLSSHTSHSIYDNNSNSNSNSNSNIECKSPIFRFVHIPEGDHDSKDTLTVISSILDSHIGPPLKEVLVKVLDRGSDYVRSSQLLPPVTSMVSDVAMSNFTLEVAEEMGITTVALETGSGCGMMGYLQHQQLIDKGIIPLKDPSYLTNGYLEMVIDWIPSFKGIRLKDMPTSIRTSDPNDKMMNHVMSSARRALNAQAIIINTFDALEKNVLKDLSSFSPNIYPIGPLNLLVDHILQRDTIIPIGPGPIESVDYLQWLDSQEPNSVLYISFGTLVVLTIEQLIELAWGIANSQQKFLWVVRLDLVIGGGSSPLPFEFEEEVKERGLLVGWCDQERVLAHPSIGGFLTHCGWNSMIESISNGVPMICSPFFAEQGTNSWYCCDVLGIGMNMIDQAMTRNEVSRVVRDLMDEGKDMEITKRAIKWRNLAREATMNSDGDSYVYLENLVNDVLYSKGSDNE